MRTIFDFGLYDASDTLYYLESGFRVVAVEANPELLRAARSMLTNFLAAGQVELIGAAISDSEDPVELNICGQDTGSSSIYMNRVRERAPIAQYTVPAVTTSQLFERFGTPYYLKVDLEGADRLAVLSLTPAARPEYLSFELGDDAEQLIEHAAAVGFSRFKLINQCTFREVLRHRRLGDRLAAKLVRMVGYAEPQYVRRAGRLFKVGHSSGPAPWCSDGKWCSLQEVLRRWEAANAGKTGNSWYDLHAN